MWSKWKWCCAELNPGLLIDIYEAFLTGILTGDWNSTQDNRRYVFPVRLERIRRCRTERDFWRSVYPVYSNITIAPDSKSLRGTSCAAAMVGEGG